MRILIISIILFQFGFAQQSIESKTKCSRCLGADGWLSKKISVTANQTNYDINYYDIDLKLDPNLKTIFGIVGIKGTVLISVLDKVELDLSSVLTIEAVKDEHSNDLNYTHSSNLLTVTLNSSIRNGDEFYIIVTYQGQPQSTGFGSFGFNDKNGAPMIWSLSEPYGARDWWPCKDTPSDKADSVDISLEVPTGLIAASNGKLVNTEINGDWTTYHWQERYPIATYLVSVAVHPYTVFYDWYKYSPSDSMRLEYYVFPENFDAVQTNYGLTKKMISSMADRFGEYPFIKEKYGHAEFPWGGGMEHQTLTSLGGHSEALIAHELGHQWWGDMVTCANFHHIWLNEGFATYSEALWYEKEYGSERMHADMAYNQYYGSGSIFVDDTTSTSQIFHSGRSYAKASWILHMLRHIVGDEDFFAGLKEYGNRYRFKSATTEQFRTVMEDVSGKNLESFFQRWIYGEFFPEYHIIYSQSDNNLLLQINQLQASDIFKMPIDILATFSDGSSKNYVIDNDQREQQFFLPITDGSLVSNVEFDPENWILKQISEIRLDTTLYPTIPTEFRLNPVYPNPFNGEVTISFIVVNYGEVELNIFDVLGRKIWTHSESFNTGNNSVNWNGKNKIGNNVPSGTYFVEASNGDLTKYQKMLLIK